MMDDTGVGHKRKPEAGWPRATSATNSNTTESSVNDSLASRRRSRSRPSTVYRRGAHLAQGTHPLTEEDGGTQDVIAGISIKSHPTELLPTTYNEHSRQRIGEDLTH